MDPIKSQNNPLVKYLHKLKKKKFREQERKYLIEGLRFVHDALKSEAAIDSLICSQDFLSSERADGLVKLAQKRVVKIIPVDSGIIKYISSTESSQEVLALCVMSELSLVESIFDKGKASNLVVLVDGVSDPGNLGTIIRSADALGADAVLLMSGTVDMYNDKTLRATMGSIFHIPVIPNLKLIDLSMFFSENETSYLMGVPRGGKTLDSIKLNKFIVLI
ncbi:MAG: RNA methyltransferase, partial [Peptococcaceae bacterium]|nr:RNA methyltransferase [Peptococcaceae bacterium]